MAETGGGQWPCGPVLSKRDIRSYFCPPIVLTIVRGASDFEATERCLSNKTFLSPRHQPAVFLLLTATYIIRVHRPARFVGDGKRRWDGQFCGSRGEEE